MGAADLPLGMSPYTLYAEVNNPGTGAEGIVAWGNYGNTRQVNAFRMGGTNVLINYWWGDDCTVTVSGVNLHDGAWHSVMVTHDGAGARNMYVDGVLQTARSGCDTTGVNTVSDKSTFCVGRSYSSEYMTGQIRNVQIFDVALTGDHDFNTVVWEWTTGGATWTQSSTGWTGVRAVPGFCGGSDDGTYE